MSQQIIKIGTKIKDGTVVSILKTGVLTVNGTYTRFYSKESIEKAVAAPAK